MRKAILILFILFGFIRESSAQFVSTIYEDNRASVVQEFYFDQAFSTSGWNGKYVEPHTTFRFQLSPQLTSETIYFIYLPVSKDVAIQQFIDHSKLECTLSNSLRVGVGYSGYRYGKYDWTHKPFLAANFSRRETILELWFEEPREGPKLQFLYKTKF